MHQIDLTSVINRTHTLVICCNECAVVNDSLHDVFVYTVPGTQVANADQALIESLRYFIEKKHCQHIIMLGHKCRMMQHNNITTKSRKVNLHAAAGETDLTIHEESIAMETQALMQIHFIRDYVSIKKLLVTGVMYDDEVKKIQTISINGTTVNSLVRLN